MFRAQTIFISWMEGEVEAGARRPTVQRMRAQQFAAEARKRLAVGSRDGSEEKEGLKKSPKERHGTWKLSQEVVATWPQSQSCLPRASLEL